MATHQKRHVQKKNVKSVEFVIKEATTDRYAEVVGCYGSCRFECQFIEGGTTNAKLKNSLKRRTKIVKGDLVLLEKDESTTGEDNYFIIAKYTTDDKKKLKHLGHLNTVKITDLSKSSIITESEAISTYTIEAIVDDDFINSV
jgi:initiation factor 1A